MTDSTSTFDRVANALGEAAQLPATEVDAESVVLFAALPADSQARVLDDIRGRVAGDRARAAGKYRSNPRRGRDVKRIWRAAKSGLSLKAFARREVAAGRAAMAGTGNASIEPGGKFVALESWLRDKS